MKVIENLNLKRITQNFDGKSYNIANKSYNLDFDGIVIHCEPSYYGNYGFFHINSPEPLIEVIILKQTIKDNLRIIKNNSNLSEDVFLRLSNILNTIDEATILEYPVALWIIINEEDYALIEYEKYSFIGNSHKAKISRPLTKVEYNHKSGNTNALLTKALYTSIFKDPMTIFMKSIMEKNSKVLNSLLTFFEHMPNSTTQEIVNSNIYTRIETMLEAFKGLNVDVSLFEHDMMQDFIDIDEITQSKDGNIDKLSDYIDEEDLTDMYLTTIELINRSKTMSIFDENYFKPLKNILFIYIMANLLFQEACKQIKNLTGIKMKTVLTNLFKAKASSMFSPKKAMMIPTFFDFDNESVEFRIEAPHFPQKENDIHKSMPFIKRLTKKSQLDKLNTQAWQSLEMRDDILVSICDYFENTNKHIDNIYNSIKIKHPNLNKNVLLGLEIDELKDIYENDNIDAVKDKLAYRYSYYNRLKFQEYPFSIREKDLLDMPEFIEKEIQKVRGVKTFRFKSYTTNNTFSGIPTTELSNEEIFCGKTITLGMLAKAGFPKPKAIILEYAPMYSYITEYAILNNIPLIFGLKYPSEMLAGKKVSANLSEITIL